MFLSWVLIPLPVEKPKGQISGFSASFHLYLQAGIRMCKSGEHYGHPKPQPLQGILIALPYSIKFNSRGSEIDCPGFISQHFYPVPV